MASAESFAEVYSKMGWQNRSVGRILGICLLQEMQRLSDQAALDAFAVEPAR